MSAEGWLPAHPIVGTFREIRQPIQFSYSGQASHRPAPLRAQHTEEILKAAEYSSEEIAHLSEIGAVEIRDEVAMSTVATTTDNNKAK